MQKTPGERAARGATGPEMPVDKDSLITRLGAGERGEKDSPSPR